jgi:hypothetical protein
MEELSKRTHNYPINLLSGHLTALWDQGKSITDDIAKIMARKLELLKD